MRANISLPRICATLIVLVGTACGRLPLGNEIVQSPIERAESPLDEYLNIIWGTDLSFEEQTRRANDLEARRVDLIAQCMHERGFEFDIHNLPSGIFVGFTSVIVPEGVLRPNDLDWVNQWGYGIMSSPFQAESPDLRLNEGPVLSDSELDAFNYALTGRPYFPPFGEFNEDNCLDWSVVVSNQEVPEGIPVWEQFAPLFEAMSQMEEEFRIQVSEADTRWSECMANDGFPGFQRQWEAQNSIRLLANDVWNRGGGLPPASDSEEEALRLQEIELAVADLTCRISTGFDLKQNELRLIAETQFVEDNRIALEALRSAAEQLP